MPAAFSGFPAADRPLENPALDTLGRAGFAERIARELAAATPREHLVVSLNGECGSGKTTLKNFIRRSLETLGSADKPAAIAFEFNATEVGCDTPLPRAFFAQLGEQLARSGTPALHSFLEAWSRHAAARQSDPAAPDAMAKTIASREQLRSSFQALPFPVVVFIDDVERLPAARIPELLRMLAALDFPNLTCFLLWQKSIVTGALAQNPTGTPAVTLRNHVHLELELPEPPDALLRRMLEAGLEQRLGAVTFPPRPRERWNDAFGSAVWPLFSTPRDVQRFVAAFAFQFDGFFHPGERVLEVNPIDLLLLETLRMFAPSVYSDLRDTFRRRETRIVRLMSGRDEERKEVRVEIDGSVEHLPLSSRQRRAVTAALQQLVPLGTGGVHGGREDWDRDLRFCSPRHVERYFHLGAVVDAAPAHRLIALTRATADREKLDMLLRQAAGEQLLPEVLDRLPALIQGLPENQLTITAVVLSGLCDEMSPDAPDDLEARLVKFAGELFSQVKNPLRRENIVAAQLDDPARLTGPILLLHALRPRSDVANGAVSASLSIEQYRRLIIPAAAKLKENAESGALWRSREAGTLIKRWWEWSTDKDEVQRWLVSQVKEPDHARAWLRSFLVPSGSAPGKEVLLQLEDLGQYCDPAIIATAVATASGDIVDRAAAKRLGQVLATKGTAAGFALRSVAVPLESDGSRNPGF